MMQKYKYSSGKYKPGDAVEIQFSDQAWGFATVSGRTIGIMKTHDTETELEFGGNKFICISGRGFWPDSKVRQKP